MKNTKLWRSQVLGEGIKNKHKKSEVEKREPSFQKNICTNHCQTIVVKFYIFVNFKIFWSWSHNLLNNVFTAGDLTYGTENKNTLDLYFLLKGAQLKLHFCVNFRLNALAWKSIIFWLRVTFPKNTSALQGLYSEHPILK